MRRRLMVGLAVGAVAVGAVGSSVVASRPDGQAATTADEPMAPVGSPDHPVVATRSFRAGAERYGTVDQRATVRDLDAEGEYAPVGTYRLTPGSTTGPAAGGRRDR